MSFFKRAREATADIAAASKRQAQRGKLEIDARRIESKMSGEKDAIGHALFPLLEAGTLKVDNLEVATHMKAIAELETELQAKRAEIEALGHEEEEAAEAEDQDRDSGAQG